MTTDLDARIRDVVNTLAGTAPDPLPFDDVVTRPTGTERPAERSHRRGLVAAGISLAVVTGIVAVAAVIDRGQRSTPAELGRVRVTHARFDYRQRIVMTCPTGQPVITGSFDRARIDIWTRSADGAERMRVTYPNGRTVDWLLLSPSASPLTTGSDLDRVRHCVPIDSGLVGPGKGTHPPTGGAKRGLATTVRGTHRDGRGREAVLWRTKQDGGIVSNGVATPGNLVLDRYLDPATGRVLEMRYTKHIEGFGGQSQTFLLVRSGMETVRPRFFSPGSFPRQRPIPVPTSRP